VHFPCLPQDVAKMSPGSREQYASICLSAFRLAAKHDYRKLAESLLQKLSETLSILRQCQHEVLEYKKLVSGFFYVLGESPSDHRLGSVTDGRSNCGLEGYVGNIQ
jgi:hypothetical protein